MPKLNAVPPVTKDRGFPAPPHQGLTGVSKNSHIPTLVSKNAVQWRGMTNDLFSLLRELALHDGAIARARAERKKLTDGLAAREKHLTQLQQQRDTLAKALNQRRDLIATERRAIDQEQERIATRKRSISAMSSVKNQAKVTREIETERRELTKREESLTKVIAETEGGTAQLKKLEDALETEKIQLEIARGESDATIATIASREAEHVQARQGIAAGVIPEVLKVYDRVVDKHPNDPLVGHDNGACRGCFMSLSPMQVVQVGKGDTIVRCPGCGRIVVA